jgi:hypothetical protein
VIQSEIVETGCDNCGKLIVDANEKITLDGYFDADHSWETGEEFCNIQCLVEWFDKHKEKLDELYFDTYSYHIRLTGNQMIDLAKLILYGKESIDA